MTSLKIAIAVHGRFDAFDLARELIQRGHQVTLLTNYPKTIVKRFGIEPSNVRSLVPHGVAGRALGQLGRLGISINADAWLHTWFGRWVACRIVRESWDVVACLSGIGEETFWALEKQATLKICRRLSAHIRTQARLLSEEAARTGRPHQQPGPWIIAREEREYAMADIVQVNSTFAYRTFLAEGFNPDRVKVILGAVSTNDFHPGAEVIEERCQRILSDAPLNVINVGTFSYRKGMWDIAEVIKQLGTHNYRFRFVGPVAPEATSLAEQLQPEAEFIPKQPQLRLPDYYRWGDVFVLPTIEDGFPVVLAQAAAAGLPILTTGNGGGPDLIDEGKTGWVLPIRDPEAFIERLRWCHTHRSELADMVRMTYHSYRNRDWNETAKEFEHLCLEHLASRR